MPPASPQSDPRREQLRRQAIQRRQAVLDRIAGTRTLAIGGAVAVSCILAGYLDASAHTRTTSTGATAAAGAGYGSSAPAYGGGSSQSVFGGGSPPTASAGAGTVVSGGS